MNFIEATALASEIREHNSRLFELHSEAKAVALTAPGLPDWCWVRVTFPLYTERDFYSRKEWVTYTQSGDIYKPGLLQYDANIPVVDEGKHLYGLHVHTYHGSFIVSADSPFADQYDWLDRIEAHSPEEAALRFSVNPGVDLIQVCEGVWNASSDLHVAPRRDWLVSEAMKGQQAKSKAQEQVVQQQSLIA